MTAALGRLATALVLVLALCAAATPRPGTTAATFPLYSGTLALGAGGRLTPVSDPQALVPGTRVLAGTADSTRLAAAQRDWLAAGTVPAVPELGGSTLVRDALLDLHVLAAGGGVAVAGGAGPWRYVWPRDAALAASALARTGHHDDAERVVAFLQRVQPVSGVFAARYLPDGSGVPDDRAPQTDSLGWALWALAEVVDQLPAGERPAAVERHRPLLDRSSRAVEALLDARSLPPPSPDYWEMDERQPTLATVALLRAGLLAAEQLYAVAGDPTRAARAGATARRVTAAVATRFGPGYPRHPGGPPGSVDLGVAFLLPPFAPSADPAAVRGWRAAPAWMSRPAGGLSPGGSWRDDGVSWTTATSTYAMTAACLGDRATAVGWLRWLDAHRTPAGSLPEKVLADGRPASVAPLAWTAAAVVIAAAQLDS